MQDVIVDYEPSTTPTMPSRLDMTSATVNFSSVSTVRFSKAVLAAVFSMLVVGTGGSASPHMINAGPSGPIVVPVIRISMSPEAESDRLFEAHEKLAGMRRYLSMNVSDLAMALRVHRPTVYAWLKGNPQLRRNHAQRLEAIYKVAKEWRAISSKPVGSFLNVQAAGISLLNLLSSKVLDHDAISARLLQIRDAAVQAPARPTVLEAAGKRNLKLLRKQTVNWASNEGLDV